MYSIIKKDFSIRLKKHRYLVLRFYEYVFDKRDFRVLHYTITLADVYNHITFERHKARRKHSVGQTSQK